MIDTHCHLGDTAFAADRDAVVQRMKAAGVSGALVVESDLARVESTQGWVASHAGLALACGCHPHDALQWSEELAGRLERLWQGGACRAAGEIGLDYHYDHSPRDQQRTAFATQLALAHAVGLPAVIHAREADADVVSILRRVPDATVVLHSFSSGPTLRDAGIAAGWYFSFSGMITFRSWHDHEAVRSVPLERLLVETDAPYLAPVPHRGKRNEPAHLGAIVATLAEIRSQSAEEVAAATTRNALRLFWPEKATGSG